MIKKIIHIADIHIPNTLDNRPYNVMLMEFISDLNETIKNYNKDEIRIVIAGDTFQQKIKLTNEAKIMFHQMLNALNFLGKTIIIAGNHDMLENNKDRKDSLTPTFEIKDVYKNVIYADKILNYKSGYIIDDNIIWGLYSMHDNFSNPNIKDLKTKYPDKKIIGLYHGEVVGAVTDNGRMSESGIDTNLFEGCDCVMAGHIHKFQEIKKKGIPIVYSGSLFQQDYGENVTGHGYVVWNVEDLKYSLHEVKNDYSIYKFSISSYDDIDEDVEKLLNY